MKKPKAYWNVFKLRMNLALKREAVRNYPVIAFIEPTLFCNLQCPACPTGLRLGLRPTVSIDEEFFRSTIDEIGDYLFQLYMYNWGEPLLHKHTPEMIRYAKEKDIKIVLSTNLSIKLTDEYIDRLVLSGLDTMIISLDGVTQESYSRYRKNGKLSLVRENVGRLRAAKQRLGVNTPKLVWQFLVFRHNEHEIEQARAIYKEWGADEFVVGGAEMPMEPHDEGFEPSTIPEFNIYHPDHPFRQSAERQLSGTRSCTWLYGVFVVNPNGKVSPCCAVPSEKYDFGEYHKGDSLFSVWNNESFRRARRMFSGNNKHSRSLSEQQKTAISKRLDGMSLRAIDNLSEDKLICQKCPIPFLQDYIDPVILDAAKKMRESVSEEKDLARKARYLANYLLMGAPDWYGLRRTRKLVKGFLSVRGPH